MILQEIQEFVRDYHKVSLAQMELHFHMDGDALRPMLKKLVKKGRIRQLPIAAKCPSCSSCDIDTLEFYEWVS
jgi:hypothetical protein